MEGDRKKLGYYMVYEIVLTSVQRIKQRRVMGSAGERNITILKTQPEDSLGSPVVKTLWFQCKGCGFKPLCHVAQPKNF